ncbi:Metallo-hydrolase/oxidoreductase [Roridomyces roridus]|uniref:Metallo-hydrolase/oxidoreductase n=1 Tax=Roridomyces roridus TaxID=1738132 RepID=A0AAD7CDS5_9AGAR|nr:Metallo-hydrolase/oxidoreductase [Roridomyces roridus]
MGLMRLPFERAKPLQHDLHGVKTIQTVKPDFGVFEATDKLCATWLGHAGFLVQLPAEPDQRPIRIVFDPMFSDRAYPSTWVDLRRRLPAPCRVQDLPEVDFIAVSHNHYDHCDIDALKQMWRTWPDVEFLVPLGVRSTLTSEGIPAARIHELDWWDKVTFPPSTHRKSSCTFTCTPAQHNSGRGVLDQNRALWCGWAVRPTTDGPSVYFAGDTGYQIAGGACPAFKEIGEKLGPFDLAMIPIWSGATLTMLGKMGYRLADDTHLATLHATPEDAVHLAKDVRARHTLAMHFATFAGSDDEALEPLVRLARAQGGTADWRAEGGFGAIDVGECVALALE